MSATYSLHKSREELESQGYQTWIVEKWQSYFPKKKGDLPGIRIDLFNCIDLVGIRSDLQGVVGIQACGEDAAEHIHKILEGYTDAKGKQIPPNPYLHIWLAAQNRFFIWSWVLRGKKGKRKLWTLREIEFRLKNGQVVAEEIAHENPL